MTAVTLPDIARQRSTLSGALSWVGMEGIALPIRLNDTTLNATVDAGVSLDEPGARGIHMSRLYLALDALENETLTLPVVHTLLDAFVKGQGGLSQCAYLSIEGDMPLKRSALISPLAGWKNYPFSLHCQLTPAGFQAQLDIKIGYSSTCPCSAALARQLIQQAFEEDFEEIPLTKSTVSAWLGSEEGVLATPHSQRSDVNCSLRLTPDSDDALPLESTIDRIEKALGTALQTAVKRIDEQAFALANGQNLMFCEDAARRVDSTLRKMPWVEGFQLKVVHAESLHAHNAVARSEWQW